MKKLLMLLIFGAVIVSGCTQNDNAESMYDKNQDGAGQDLTTNDNGKHEGGDFVNEGDNDMTLDDQNPNLLNTDNQNRHNYSQDVQKAKEVISAKGFKPGQIWINGENMNVTVEYDGRMSKKKRERAEKSLKEGLTRALPRYDVNVDFE